MIGALVAGFPAHVFDRLLARHLPSLLMAMDAQQRAEVLAAQAEVRQSAEHYLSVTTAERGSAADPAADGGSSSALVDVEEAAMLLGVRSRQMRTLAQRLEVEGQAHKVGHVWLLDRAAVEVLASSRRNRSVA